MNQSTPVERPTILTWGIILMAAKSAFYLLLLLIGLVGVPVIFGIGALDSHGDEFIPIVLIGSLFEFVLFIIVILQLLGLYACKRAWESSRTWLIVLMVLAGLSALDSGPIGLIIAGLTIVGGIQVLERSKLAAPVAPEPPKTEPASA